MQFLHGRMERHWKTHLGEEPGVPQLQRSFEQSLPLVRVGQGNQSRDTKLQEITISSPCVHLFILFLKSFMLENMLLFYSYASIHVTGLGSCFAFLSYWESIFQTQNLELL